MYSFSYLKPVCCSMSMFFFFRGFLFIYTRHINPLNLRTQYKKKKKPLQLIYLTMLFIFMTPFFVVVVLFPNNKGGDLGLLGWYIWGSSLPTSPTHHQGEQEEEKRGQGPQQSFIILNAREEEERKGGKKKKRKYKSYNTYNRVGMVWEWDRHEAEAWGGPLGVGGSGSPPHSFLSLMLFP